MKSSGEGKQGSNAPFTCDRAVPHRLLLRLYAHLLAYDIENLLLILGLVFKSPLSMVIVHCEHDIVIQTEDNPIIEIRAVGDLGQMLGNGGEMDDCMVAFRIVEVMSECVVIYLSSSDANAEVDLVWQAAIPGHDLLLDTCDLMLIAKVALQHRQPRRTSTFDHLHGHGQA